MIGPTTAASIWIPPRLANRIRRVGTALGAIALTAAFFVGVGMPVIGLVLPTATGLVFGLTASTSVVLGLLLAVSGVTLIKARGWVSLGRHPGGTDFLFSTHPAAIGAVVLFSTAFGSILCSAFFFAGYSGHITWSDGFHSAKVHPVTPSIVLFLLLPALAVVVTLVNVAVGWPLLRPSQRSIRRYAR